MNLKLICIILAGQILQYCLAETGKNILVFIGGGSYSHILGLWPLTSALADRGHNVTLLSGFKNLPFKNPKVHELFSSGIYNMTQEIYPPDRVRDRLQNKHSWVYDHYIEHTVKSCATIMEAKGDPILDYVINEGKFDLIIDNAHYGECGMMIAHQKKSKLILHYSCAIIPWLFDEYGFPDESATIPHVAMGFSFPMNIWQRFKNYLAPLYWFMARRFDMFPKLEGIMQKRYNLKSDETPAYQDIVRNADLVFLATHYSNELARSLPPFVVSIGGMPSFLPTEPLSAEFKTILDNATHGAVLIAFGSTINLATLPPEIKSIFLDMMRNFPKILFIWRWDGPEPENQPVNLIVSKWLPQFQILGHPNLKAFISHAGLNSLSEATYHGVPVILLPLFIDQDYNGYRIEATEIGIRLEMQDLNSKVLIQSLSEILNNPKYASNMNAMSAIFRDRPMNPIETAVYWTEFVLRHNDTKSLKPIQNLTFFQRRYYDVALILILITSSVLALLFCIGFGLVQRMPNSKKFNIEFEPETKQKRQ